MQVSSGGGFTLLGILFIGLKLTGYIDWSWWWVLAPFWGPIAFGLLVIICVGFASACSSTRQARIVSSVVVLALTLAGIGLLLMSLLTAEIGRRAEAQASLPGTLQND